MLSTLCCNLIVTVFNSVNYFIAQYLYLRTSQLSLRAGIVKNTSKDIIFFYDIIYLLYTVQSCKLEYVCATLE